MVVVFVSAELAARDWARLGRRAALAPAVRERREYVLPARFDDTPLPGLLSDMVTVDLGGRSPQQIAAVVAAQAGRFAITPSALSTDAEDSAWDTETARREAKIRGPVDWAAVASPCHAGPGRPGQTG